MADDTVTLIVDDVRGGEIPADGFVRQLSAFLEALEASDREASLGRPSVEWVVRSLSRSSPAVVELTAIAKRDSRKEAGSEAVERFFDLLDSLQGDEAGSDREKRASRKTLKAFKALGKQVGRDELTASVHNSRRKARISPVLAPRVAATLAPTRGGGWVSGGAPSVDQYPR